MLALLPDESAPIRAVEFSDIVNGTHGFVTVLPKNFMPVLFHQQTGCLLKKFQHLPLFTRGNLFDYFIVAIQLHPSSIPNNSFSLYYATTKAMP